MMEIFKNIQNYEGLYMVSNYGNIKSLPKGDGNGNRERLLKFDIAHQRNTSYARVTLSKNGKTKRYLVHRLVAEAFIENKDNKLYVNHIDNNGLNNNEANLEWCTHSENMLHAVKQGRLFEAQSKGGKAASAVLSSIAIKRHNENIGKIFGFYLIKDILGKKPNKPYYYYICTCLTCGTDYEVNSTNLLSGKTMGCRSCGLKRSHKNRIKI